jgi:hypothetical protein
MTPASIRLFVLVALLATASFARAQPAPPSFSAGIARREVTPKEPVPMWGYGARHDALSTGTLDPLYATALVIEAAGIKLAIVGLDLGRAPSERSLQEIRRRLKAEAGIEYSFIAGSHTHHGPVLELSDEEGKGKGRFDAAIRYYRQLEEGIVGAVVEANSRLASARMATGSVRLEGFNRNRQTKIEPKPVDRELAVLRLDDRAGKPIAVLVNFAAHPTMVPGATLKFSADYVGALRAALEKETGATSIFMQGAAGDLSVNPGSNGGHESFGEALGKEAARLALSLETREVTNASLAVREERFQFASRTDLSNPVTRAAYGVAFFPELVANYADDYAGGVRPRLTVALLNGDIALVGVSGEFFASHAIRLKERARVRQLFFFGYSNGYHQYFPTIEAAAEGGYGADNTVAPAEVGAGEQVMNAALIWIYRILGKIK